LTDPVPLAVPRAVPIREKLDRVAGCRAVRDIAARLTRWLTRWLASIDAPGLADCCAS